MTDVGRTKANPNLNGAENVLLLRSTCKASLLRSFYHGFASASLSLLELGAKSDLDEFVVPEARRTIDFMSFLGEKSRFLFLPGVVGDVVGGGCCCGTGLESCDVEPSSHCSSDAASSASCSELSLMPGGSTAADG